MRRRFVTAGILVLLGLAVAAYLIFVREPHHPVQTRIPELTAQVEKAHKDMDEAVRTYAPKVPGPLFSDSAEEILKQLPGVAKVEASHSG